MKTTLWKTKGPTHKKEKKTAHEQEYTAFFQKGADLFKKYPNRNYRVENPSTYTNSQTSTILTLRKTRGFQYQSLIHNFSGETFDDANLKIGTVQNLKSLFC